MAKHAKKTTIRKSIRLENGQLLQRTFSNKEDANEWYAEQLRRKQRSSAGLDEPITANTISISEYSQIFMRRRVTGGAVVKGTWRNDGSRLYDYVLPLVGKKLLQTVKTPDWEKVLDIIQNDPIKIVSGRRRELASEAERAAFEKKLKRHKKQLSNTTRNAIRAMLHTLYEEAIKDKLLFSNPIAHVPVKDQGDPEDKIGYWETQEECIRYLAEHLKFAREIGNYSWYCWACWALGKGTRVHELLALTHSDVDLDNTRIRIKKIYDPNVNAIVDRTKGSRRSKRGGRRRASRWLYLNKPMVDAYKLLWEKTPNKKPTDYIFLNTRSADFNGIKSQSNKLGLTGVTNIHELICKRAGVQLIRVHDLRHTFASHFLMNGGTLPALAEILGHSTTYVTERYGHLSESYLERETDRVKFDISLDDNVIKLKSKKNAGRDA